MSEKEHTPNTSSLEEKEREKAHKLLEMQVLKNCCRLGQEFSKIYAREEKNIEKRLKKILIKSNRY